MERKCELERVTKETNIKIMLNLDGNSAHSKIDTSSPFFDHMLTHISTHGRIELIVKGQGDVEIDDHHLVEDCGILFGQAIKKAWGEKRGILRYGHFLLPMDETLVEVAIDLSGRPHLTYQVNGLPERIGSFDTELAREFFQALVNHSGMTLHINVRYGINGHHILEGVFKGFGRALAMAISADSRLAQDQIPSSKGVL